VLAHELGHWKLKHTVYNFAAMQLVVIVQVCDVNVGLPLGLAAVGAGVGKVSEVGLLLVQGLPCAAF
jgi:Zn-dependent protease with chaperone function